MPWGNANNAGAVPTELVTMKTAGYSNTFISPSAQSEGVFSHSAAGASGTGLHSGWIHREVGTGSVKDLTIVAGGTGYASGDRWSVTGGTTQANGALVVTGGVITGFTVDNKGSGFKTKTATVTITTAAGTGATLTANVGGRAGRVFNEVLVAQSR